MSGAVRNGHKPYDYCRIELTCRSQTNDGNVESKGDLPDEASEDRGEGKKAQDPGLLVG